MDREELEEIIASEGISEGSVIAAVYTTGQRFVRTNLRVGFFHRIEDVPFVVNQARYDGEGLVKLREGKLDLRNPDVVVLEKLTDLDVREDYFKGDCVVPLRYMNGCVFDCSGEFIVRYCEVGDARGGGHGWLKKVQIGTRGDTTGSFLCSGVWRFKERDRLRLITTGSCSVYGRGRIYGVNTLLSKDSVESLLSR